MKTIQELKKEKQDKFTELSNACGLFWAFSTEQFNENKTPLKEGEKYVAIGAGGYMPKGNVKQFRDGMDELDKWFKDAVKENKARRALIVYELRNHECFYTGELEPALDALGEDFTMEEVREVYKTSPEYQD